MYFLLVCVKYLAIHGGNELTKGLLKRGGVKDIWWRYRWDFDFPTYYKVQGLKKGRKIQGKWLFTYGFIQDKN